MSEVVYGFVDMALLQLAVDWSYPVYAVTAIGSILLAGAAWDGIQHRKAVRATARHTPQNTQQRHFTPPPRAYAQMVSPKSAAVKLERYIRDKGESRWMPKEMIYEEYFLPMCGLKNITVASWDGVYRQLCQQVYATKARVRVLSNDFNYLGDYIDTDRPYLVRIASTQEIQLIQEGKLSDMLNRPSPTRKSPKKPRVAKRKLYPGPAERKPLAAQANTWDGQDQRQTRRAA